MDKTDESCSMLRCCADDERGWAVAIEALDPCTPINRRRGTRRSYDPIVAHDRKLLHSIGCRLPFTFYLIQIYKSRHRLPRLLDWPFDTSYQYIHTYIQYLRNVTSPSCYVPSSWVPLVFVCLFVCSSALSCTLLHHHTYHSLLLSTDHKS